MSGYELAEHLRKLDGGDAIKLVALTGYGQASDRQRSAEAGFDAHLVKPVGLVNIRETIQELTAPAS